MNTTTSDIDSQPATPSSQADPSEEPQSPTVYTYDGPFKVPRARTDSVASQSEQEYIIAQRTRSKISLAETPIEAIESTFKAPDAPTDLYQFDPDVDDEWLQFLRNCCMPLSKSTQKYLEQSFLSIPVNSPEPFNIRVDFMSHDHLIKCQFRPLKFSI